MIIPNLIRQLKYEGPQELRGLRDEDYLLILWSLMMWSKRGTHIGIRMDWGIYD